MTAKPLVEPHFYLFLRLLGRVPYPSSACGIDEMIAVLVQLLEELSVGGEADGVDAH